MDGTEEHMKRMKKGMLSIVICLPAEEKSDATSSHDSAAGTPIGFICLMAPPEGMGYAIPHFCSTKNKIMAVHHSCSLMYSDTTATPWSD
jgi:hypothetical protein